MSTNETSGFDVVILGCGPAGERAAIYASRAGKSVAVIERHSEPGGARVNWGTIPSKTLRESALLVQRLSQGSIYGIHCGIEEPLTIVKCMEHEKEVVRLELEIINAALERNEIPLLRGHGRFVDPHRVAVIGSEEQTRMHVSGDTVVIAVGTSPNRPTDVPFDDTCVFDSNGILSLKKLPRSMLVLGAGVIGIEYTCIFAALGVELTVIDTRKELLPFLDSEITGILEREMRRLGVVILHDDHYAKIERLKGKHPGVRCTTRKGNVLEADVMLYSVGRDGNTRDLGLETIGIEPDKRGLLEVNEFYQTAHPHIYAVGDVIGYPALASTSMEQGRQAIRHALNIPGLKHTSDSLPYAIFSIPEVSYIGENEQTLQEKGIKYIVGRGRYSLNARGQILSDTGGLLKLIFDEESLKLLGVHIIGTQACELISTGHAYLSLGATAEGIANGIFNYPSLSDLYRHAALEALISHHDLEKAGITGTVLDEHYYLKHTR